MHRIARCPYLVLGLSLLGCGSKVAERSVPSASPAAATARVGFSAEGAQQGAGAASFWASQKLIRKGELRLRVSSVESASAAADTIARAHGGLLADSRMSQDAAEGHQAQLVFRIPSERFMEATTAFRRLGDVRSETVNAQDITKEYADLETRVAVQQQTVTRLRALLDSRTAKLADVLEVERELGRAMTELEQMKGERRFYDQQVALSTLTLVLFESDRSRASQLTIPISDALHRGLEVLGTSLAGVVYVVVFFLPWLLLGAAGWWIAQRLRGRRPFRGQSPPPEPPAN